MAIFSMIVSFRVILLYSLATASSIILLSFYAVTPSKNKAMSVLPALKQLVVPPRAAHTSTIIFLHGLGDTGAGWKSVAEMLAPSFPGTKWILPSARMLPVTINMQMKMSAWFDIASLTEFENEDEKGLLSGVQAINEIITAEVDAGTPADKIILGGFSQGCALGLLTGLTTERKLGGLICLSGWLPIRKTAIASMTDHARNLPVFWGHGTEDQVVQYSWGEMSVKILQGVKFRDVTFKSYPMGHEAGMAELRDLQAWLEKLLNKS